MSSGPAMYDYQRGSTMATRSLISDQKPSELIPAAHASADPKASLHRQTTDHYEKAVAASKTADSGSEGKPVLDRQQSWKMSDFKREHAEKMLNGQPSGQGYSSKSQ